MMMNDELSYDIKKKFMKPMTTELQDHKEKVLHNAQVSLGYHFQIQEPKARSGHRNGSAEESTNRAIAASQTNDELSRVRNLPRIIKTSFVFSWSWSSQNLHNCRTIHCNNTEIHT